MHAPTGAQARPRLFKNIAYIKRCKCATLSYLACKQPAESPPRLMTFVCHPFPARAPSFFHRLQRIVAVSISTCLLHGVYYSWRGKKKKNQRVESRRAPGFITALKLDRVSEFAFRSRLPPRNSLHISCEAEIFVIVDSRNFSIIKRVFIQTG